MTSMYEDSVAMRWLDQQTEKLMEKFYEILGVVVPDPEETKIEVGSS